MENNDSSSPIILYNKNNMEMNEEYFKTLPTDVQEYLRITRYFNVLLDVQTYSFPIIQILFLIMFIYRIFIQKSANFTSAYFYILVLEYIINSIISIVYFLDFKTPIKFEWFITFMIDWYLYRFYAFCNTILVVNRFTGVFCFKQHGKIWSGWNFKIIYILIIAYPFILSGYTLDKIGLCLNEETRMECGQIFSPTFKLPTLVLASNLINAILALSLGLATALARKIKGNKWQKRHKYETYLLVQSIITSTLLIIYEILNIIRATTDPTPPPGGFDFGWNLRMYFLIISIGVMKQVFHVSSIILLFIISKIVRDSFLSFYHLNFLVCKRKRNNVIAATISTSHHNINSKTHSFNDAPRLTRVSSP